jgi:hypothetical protein
MTRTRVLPLLLGPVALAVAGASLAIWAAPVRADGDPASDYLLSQQVFLPFDTKIPSTLQGELIGLVREVNRAGYRIRVALIGSSYDLGAVTALWRQPKKYARFLGAELAFVYKGPLLVVMPNGLGFNDPGHSPAAGYRAIAGVSVGGGGAALAQAAITAVQRLAAVHGVRVSPPKVTSTAGRNHSDRITILIAVAAFVAIAAAGWLLRRRLRPKRARA